MSTDIKKKLRWVGLTALILLVMVFTIQNIEVVTVTFLWFEVSMSRAILVIVLLIIGFVLGKFSRMRSHVNKH